MAITNASGVGPPGNLPGDPGSTYLRTDGPPFTYKRLGNGWVAADVIDDSGQIAVGYLPPLTNGSLGPPGPPGEDGDTGQPGLPGQQGTAGATGQQGPLGYGPEGEQGDEGPMGPPGIPGQGIPGLAGQSGRPGQDGTDGEDGDVGPPGPAGPQGTAGTPGSVGAQGPLAYGPEGEQGDEGPMGPPGPQGLPGAAGGAATTIEVDLGSTLQTQGKFTITDGTITAGKKILVWQAPGPYTNKGTLADEAEMAPVTILNAVAGLGSAVVAWRAEGYMAMTQAFLNGSGQPGGTTVARGTGDARLAVVSGDPRTQISAMRIGRVRGNYKFTYMVLG